MASNGKYVPPHCRRGGGGGSGSNSSNRSATQQQQQPSSSLSRWSNVSSQDTAHQQRSSSAHEHRPSRGSGSSRWGNVADIDSSRPRPSYNRPTSTSGGGASRWGNVTDPSLRAPAPGSKRSAGPTPTKVAFFGDSFVRLFGLLERSDILVRGFKGASAKGLGRDNNENRETIQNFVESPAGRSVERLIFVFGSVDVHLSFYYMKYVKGEDIDLINIAERYVDFVADLSTVDSAVQKIIVGVYFSPLADADVGPSLASYGSLTDEQAALVSGSHDAELHVRQERVMAFNRALKRRSEERGVQYDDINDEMTDAESLEIKDAYKDVSNHNIHIVWETTLLVWLDKWAWFRELTPPGFAEGLQRTLEKYLKTKPWAERTHVAETVGVEGAVHKDQI